jgi:hypothetical protein
MGVGPIDGSDGWEVVRTLKGVLVQSGMNPDQSMRGTAVRGNGMRGDTPRA